MTAEQPQIGSVWAWGYPWTWGYPYYSTHQALTVLVLDNSIQHHGASTRVLVIYSDGIISEESWSSSAFGWSSSAFGSTPRKYTLIYSPEERDERGET